MKKLEVMIPEKLQDKAGFDAVSTPGDLIREWAAQVLHMNGVVEDGAGSTDMSSMMENISRSAAAATRLPPSRPARRPPATAAP